MAKPAPLEFTRFLRSPASLFCVVSTLAGLVTIAVTPPLRGPDENAHFLRAYGLWKGDFIPSQTDAEGRKGLLLPETLNAEFDFFNAAREGAGKTGFSYRQVFRDYSNIVDDPLTGPSLFTPYAGSEGYTPVAYIPYVVGAGLAELVNLSFLPMLYVMRILGLLTGTALIAYAIARTPVLRWNFFAVAMLPSAILGRSAINADGALLGATLVVIALCLDATGKSKSPPIWRTGWMSLCALTKPSQIVFVLLELFARPLRSGWRGLLGAALVITPALGLTILWVLVAGTDSGAWRLYDGTDLPPEQFQTGWKLRYMLAHPQHFPSAMFSSLDYSTELWRQLIGVLGWLDTKLHPLAYPVLTGALIVSSVDKLDLPLGDRTRVASVAIFTALAYWVLVFGLLFVTSTPINSDRVLGVQGRYFLVLVPLVALAAAALNVRRPPPMLQAGAGILLSGVSALAVLEAVLRTDWN